MTYLEKEDLELYNLIKKEEIRQEEHIELIASENFVSKAPKAKIDLEKQKYENYKDKLSQILLKLKNI